ncbi:putative serine/threonine-protein kinase DDB_G0286841 [Lithobates pipiens]
MAGPWRNSKSRCILWIIRPIRFIAAELLCAIQALHSRGIVHSDLHSKNILIDSTGHVKIMDFGLSERKGVPYNVNTTITYVRGSHTVHLGSIHT